MSSNKRLLIWIAVFSLLIGGLLFTQVRAENNIWAELKPFFQAYQAIQNRYIKKVDPSKLVQGAIKGMIKSLKDPHSYWLDPRSYKEMKIEKEGKLGGTGMRITIKETFPIVVSCIEGTPASKVDIQPGDKIIKINGESTEGITLPEAAERLRGDPETDVTITIQREEEEEPFEFTLTRVIYKIPNIKKKLLEGDIGYLKITEFTNENTAKDVENALVELEKEMATSLILDLRNNPGGGLLQAIKVADEFISSGVIISIRGREPSEEQVYHAHPEGKALKIPLVVLINEGSASASEIVAGAIKDQKRGVLLGTRTFGKGTVQIIIPLKDQGAVGLTTANYYTPSGKCIEGKGIEPDIRIEAFRPDEHQKKILSQLRKSGYVEKFLIEHPVWEEDLAPLMDKLNKEEIQVEEPLLKRVLRERDKDKDNNILNDLQLWQAVKLLRSLKILKGT
ncbi:MAG: S41 family peptidase [Candidatus Aerophobetes bacterium]|nr:S41 family peptidase [Candidatus Aerophobetes bacterium]